MSSALPLDRERLRAALARASDELLAARAPEGHWVGELSSSALSTATAVTALAVVGREAQSPKLKAQIDAGLAWLAAHANDDGGWGDTTRSLSNLSTTALCWAAFGAVSGADEKFAATWRGAERWLARHVAKKYRPHLTPAPSPPSGSGEGEAIMRVETDALARAIIARYGKDRTFSVPILTMGALAGRLGSGREAWKHVIPLPFELAALPHQFFAALRLPVVSYALPALIAIGQARHHHAPSRNPLARLVRNVTRDRTLRVLTGIQPANGGFLEATPLTSFVTLSLAGSGQADHVVTRRGVEFLLASQRADGSWPIDTNLATWLTTLAVNALTNHQSPIINHQSSIHAWLLAQQYRVEHPYTHAAPGGWAWTDLPGGVPDADDTAGALIALRHVGTIDEQTRTAAFAGIQWLLDLQNNDGGIPTFCRGWGALPFDRSSADITAHAIRAWLRWLDEMPPKLRSRAAPALRKAIEFLSRARRADGCWVPLWFGNQFAPDEENPTYGTARVLCAISEAANHALTRSPLTVDLRGNGVHWLVKAQNADGGWGGAPGIASSVEETALAVEALATAHSSNVEGSPSALARGAGWLIERVESGTWREPSPIGFYFAKLWYCEKLYPLIFTVGALSRCALSAGG